MKKMLLVIGCLLALGAKGQTDSTLYKQYIKFMETEEYKRLGASNDEQSSGYAYGKILGASKIAGQMDEKTFKGAFGSIAEYNLEEGLKYNSHHHHLIMAIGAKGWWLREIPTYMAESLNCSNHIDGDNDYYPTDFDVHPGITSGDDDASSVHIRSVVDDSLRVKKVTITGNSGLLVKLFLWYWYESELKFDVNKFKNGCMFYQNSGSDRICFNWKGAKPNITITKNPTFPVPLPIALGKDRKN